jgi:RNA polymerase sigma-70 factor (ECF subfamily)
MNYLTLQSKINEMSDSEVLSRSLVEPEIFEIIVRRYQREFFRKAKRIARTDEDAEDIVQDTFVKIYRFGKSFKHQEGASFKSWGYKILTNTCYTHCTKQKRRDAFFTLADDDMLDMYSNTADEREHMLDVDYVSSVINKIPKALGSILSLALSGKTQEDIAKILGISVGAVRTRMHRARKAVDSYINYKEKDVA